MCAVAIVFVGSSWVSVVSVLCLLFINVSVVVFVCRGCVSPRHSRYLLFISLVSVLRLVKVGILFVV